MARPERFELPTFWFVAVNSLLILRNLRAKRRATDPSNVPNVPNLPKLTPSLELGIDPVVNLIADRPHSLERLTHGASWRELPNPFSRHSETYSAILRG